jgi:heat shock protein HtpX
VYEQITRNKRRSLGYVGVFIVLWLGIGLFVGWIAALSSARQPGDSAPVTADITTGILIAALLALAVAGAQPADPQRYPQLYNLLEALAIGDGMPMPAVYVVEDRSPNAFATGISPSKAAVTVTTGLLAVMDREELEGVLGHEISHIKNYDTRLLLIVTTLLGMAGLLASLIWRSAFFARGGRGRNNNQFAMLLLLAGLLLAIVGFIVGPIIRMALSRRRESLADASSVELTRNPVGLIRALKTLQNNDVPLAKANHSTAAMCIDDPLQHHESSIHRLFDTHPPIAERIATLERMAQGTTV